MYANGNKTRQKIQNLNWVILSGFTAIAFALIFWSVIRANTILAREDNPRLVEAELRIQRGHIFDKNDSLLAETIGHSNELSRHYPIATIGPAVGYYSFRHGTAGVEESFDTILRGESEDIWINFRRQALHELQVGQNIRLTLDAQWQRAADALMGEEVGALILLSLAKETAVAEITAMVSHPSYDPNQLDLLFDELTENELAPLLNRVTQGQYQPGLLLQPFILATALENNVITFTEPVPEAAHPVIVEGNIIQCATQPPENATWLDVWHHQCPAPMMALADQLGVGGLDRLFTDFGLTQAPQLSLNTETPNQEPMADPLLAGIGQDNFLVTPLQISLALAAVANNGQRPALQLVTAVQETTGEWREQLVPTLEVGNTAVLSSTALTMRQNWQRQGAFAEFSVLVLSGPEGSSNGWYLGMAPAIDPQYVIVLVVEESEGLQRVQTIGRSLLTAVLAP